jgi:hypothetical protein
MKWYTVSEYNPPISTECLIRTINTMYYIARLESIENPDTWISDYFCEKCESCHYEKIHNVTHFAFIEPTPIMDISYE